MAAAHGSKFEAFRTPHPRAFRPAAVRAVAVLVAAGAALAACTDTPGTRAGTPTTSPTVAANAGLGNAPAPSAPASPALSGPADPLSSPQVVTEAAFASPSGNIGCYLTAESARCDIAQKSWSAGAAPADCQLDWGSGISVGKAGAATFTCAGDTVLGAKDELAYGQALKAGDFRCDSLSKGMRCENVASGHGFTVAKEQYNLF